MHAGAALGGRAHPFIHYDPEAGATWARRLDLGGNPQPEADWPLYELAFESDTAESRSVSVAFTFADFLLLEPRFRDHFRVIPDGIPEDELTPLADRLARSPEDEEHTIPFVWAADATGGAHRLVVDRVLERACRDRLDYWRTLQELAGIRNEHVQEAVGRERARLEDAFAAERTLLQQEHEAELAHVRQDESRAVMHRLAQSLLGIDVDALAETVVAPAPPPVPPVDAAPAVAEPDADVTTAPPTEPTPSRDDEDDDGGEEPWIDSALCTSCNDCLGINPQLFVYNGNKQAVIGDASAGTYAQLVQAAEKCPARCIHPGRPVNPDEPGLDALVERARPFNT
jgi:ferredoxin